jgi:hypothetical protein
VYSLGSFAFSPSAAGAVFAALRLASSALAACAVTARDARTRRAGCGVGRGEVRRGTDAVSGRSRGARVEADSEDRWRARGRAAARAYLRGEAAEGGGTRGDTECGVRRRHRVGS